MGDCKPNSGLTELDNDNDDDEKKKLFSSTTDKTIVSGFTF